VVSGGAGIGGQLNVGGALNYGSILRSSWTSLGPLSLDGNAFVEWTNIPSHAREIKLVYRSSSRTVGSRIQVDLFNSNGLGANTLAVQTYRYDATNRRDATSGSAFDVWPQDLVAGQLLAGEVRVSYINQKAALQLLTAEYAITGKTYSLSSGTRRAADIVGLYETPVIGNTFSPTIFTIRFSTSAGTFNTFNDFAHLYWM